jgi:hypothetical protein
MPDDGNIVLLPRFTSLASVGKRTFTTEPIPVTKASAVEVTFWRGAFRGSDDDPVFVLQIQTSLDLEAWSPGGTFLPDAGVEYREPAALKTAWFRLAITLQHDDGSEPEDAQKSVSCWVLAAFTPRVSQCPGDVFVDPYSRS